MLVHVVTEVSKQHHLLSQCLRMSSHCVEMFLTVSFNILYVSTQKKRITSWKVLGYWKLDLPNTMIIHVHTHLALIRICQPIRNIECKHQPHLVNLPGETTNLANFFATVE